MKAIKIVTLSLLALVVVLGGGFYVTQKAKQDYMLEVARSEEVKALIEKELMDLDAKAFTSDGKIQSYEILYDETHTTPMGGLFVYLIINDNPEYDISLGLDKNFETNQLEIVSGSRSSKLLDFLREEK